ncbi:uncharacterized protein VTP21DRAFT_5369 [Calcarisporiella thermophila]|uniref:uncharacterized protein n=1 Tax=Calcarisporiella thermophila TaxID=911321 RepID=UPI0037431DE8
MPKIRPTQKQRHDPLHVQLDSTKNPSTRPTSRSKFAARSEARNAVQDSTYVDAKLSKKILKIAREQQDEIEAEEMSDEEEEEVKNERATERVHSIRDLFDSDNEEDVKEDYEELEGGDEEIEELELDEKDQEILEAFMPAAPRARRTLADLIMEKIEAQRGSNKDLHGEEEAEGEEGERAMPPGMNPKVVEVYTKVGTLLSRYKSGKLPKAFKIIPSLPNWEEILYITVPEQWTPHATYEATRIFVANLKVRQVQKFFSFVLLDRVRDDIQENKKLNYHLYMALKKAMFKPAAFFKGVLFPLCESGTCTLKEAAIIGSVLTKVSVPVLHSSAALLRLAEMDYTGPNSLFIRVLLDKKYALPYKVVDALVHHFIRFRTDSRTMPVLWHQALLVFVQRYKQDLTPEQKEALLELLRHKSHELITPEIRREIANSVARGDIIGEADDIMMDDF